mgnify:FL=1
MFFVLIFILLSIKTRIETCFPPIVSITLLKFLSYYPLKQGLKLLISLITRVSSERFLSYYPLKQGLKHHAYEQDVPEGTIFILLSIKTRIETNYLANR